MIIHKELLKTSQEKTEIIKAGDIEKLQHTLTKERKYIQLLEQFEAKRERNVKKWFEENQITTNEFTITNILEMTHNEIDKKNLEQVMVQLTTVITQLKQQEQLNQDLTRQSLQFVQMSLNMLNPSIMDMNYGKRESKKPINQSVFDSRA